MARNGATAARPHRQAQASGNDTHLLASEVSTGRGSGLTLTIDLPALVANWSALKRQVAPTDCPAVVKANAYGLGVDKVVPALWAAGCRTFFVALPSEGVEVRRVAPEAEIHVLNGFFPDAAELYVQHRLQPVLSDAVQAQTWARLPGAGAAGVQIDTGMNRLGLHRQEAPAFAASGLVEAARIGWVMSHLACSEIEAHPLNGVQLARFREASAGFGERKRSLSDSDGIALGRDYWFDIVRPGIALYGGSDRHALNTVVTAEARILQVRTGDPGDTVGYGAARMLRRRSRLAVLSAGYADGWVRSAGSFDYRHGTSVTIAGREAPLMGPVSMDLMVADVSDIPEADVRVGDGAQLFGPDMPIIRAAAAAGTIPYELLTGLSRRAKRVYVGDEG